MNHIYLILTLKNYNLLADKTLATPNADAAAAKLEELRQGNPDFQFRLQKVSLF